MEKMVGRLRDRRIAILAADGFEKVELTVPLRAMQVAGAKVDVISLRHGRIRGVNLHEPASRIHVNKTLDEASVADYDALFIPGGLINPDLLRQSREARDFVKRFVETGKPVAAMCHAPWVLASAELLDGRTLTSWPGIRDDLVNAGATWVDEPVVRDRNLLTSRGPQDLKQFVPALVEFFASRGQAPVEIENAALAPRRNQPPAVMLKALRWMPRPSLRTAFGIGAIVAAALAIRRSRRAILALIVANAGPELVKSMPRATRRMLKRRRRMPRVEMRTRPHVEMRTRPHIEMGRSHGVREKLRAIAA